MDWRWKITPACVCIFIGTLEWGFSSVLYIRWCLGWNCPCRNTTSGKIRFCNFDKQAIPSARSASTYYSVNSRCCLKIITLNEPKLLVFPKGNYIEPASNCSRSEGGMTSRIQRRMRIQRAAARATTPPAKNGGRNEAGPASS